MRNWQVGVAAAIVVAAMCRVVATLQWRAGALTPAGWSAWFDSALAGFSTRVRWSLDDDAELYFALERVVPADAMLLLYATEVQDPDRTRDRMVLLQLRLQALRYPAEVRMGYGPIQDAAVYAPLLRKGMWLVNVTPSTPTPLARYFDVVERTPAFELALCDRAGP